MGSLNYILGTAGHIDHGKSTLVKTLTGTDPDRLPEEKARGLTIDLGFAHLDLPGKNGDSLSVGVIDVPGHADFVKNMVAGVGSIDAALIAIAADDRWMPQTEEHLQILEYLGVADAVVALTKSDLASNLEETIQEIQVRLLDTGFADAPIIPVSALKGDGLGKLKTAVAEMLQRNPPAADLKKPRLFVDRVFSPKGIGTVVTGTLSGGSLQRGQKVVIHPHGLKSNVRGLQSHESQVEMAVPGMRTAINLADIGIGSRREKGVARGSIVSVSGLTRPTSTVDVFIARSAREVPGQPVSAKPVRNGQRVRFHYGSASASARIYFLDHRNLAPGESAVAQLRFDSPVAVFFGDRFVLRDWPRTCSLAGGQVLDPAATRKGLRTESQRQFLKVRAADIGSLRVALATLLQRDKAIVKDQVLSASSFSRQEIDNEISALQKGHALIQSGDLLLAREWCETASQKLVGYVKEFHAKNPASLGMPIPDVRQCLADEVESGRLFQILIELAGARGGLVRNGNNLRLTSHRAELPAEFRAAGNKIRKTLAANPLEPPNPKELAPGPVEKKALAFLIETGEAIYLGEKCVLLTETFEEAGRKVIACLRKSTQATVSDLRKELGTTRRILMPILDRLDKDGVTVRLDDFRMLSRSFLRKHGG